MSEIGFLLTFSVGKHILDVPLRDAALGVVLSDMAEVVILPDHPVRLHADSTAQGTYISRYIDPPDRAAP